MRRAGKVDANQAMIVRALRDAGASVSITSSLGSGHPDIAVGWRGRNFYFEIKDSNLPPSRKRLTPDEQAWHNTWRGQVDVIESVEDAFSILERE